LYNSSERVCDWTQVECVSHWLKLLKFDLVAGARASMMCVIMCVGPRKAMMDVLGSDEDALEAALGLGELAGLTTANEADAYDVRSF